MYFSSVIFKLFICKASHMNTLYQRKQMFYSCNDLLNKSDFLKISAFHCPFYLMNSHDTIIRKAAEKDAINTCISLFFRKISRTENESPEVTFHNLTSQVGPAKYTILSSRHVTFNSLAQVISSLLLYCFPVNSTRIIIGCIILNPVGIEKSATVIGFIHCGFLQIM